MLVNCPVFDIEHRRLCSGQKLQLTSRPGPRVFVVVDGNLAVAAEMQVTMARGEFCLLPAAVPLADVRALSDADLLVVSMPEERRTS